MDESHHEYGLFISAPPVFVATPTEVNVTRSRDARFVCVATGQPRPTIFWTRDGERLGDDSTRIVVQQSTSPEDMTTLNSTLTITATTYTDAGTYACVAVNADGNNTAVTSLYVQGISIFHL